MIDLQNDAALARLRSSIARNRSLLVAFSGGIDSTLVLKVAHDVLGERAAGALAVSASLPASERREAESLASWIGAKLHTVETHELEDPRYVSNSLDRCYYCKSELFTTLDREARRLGYDAIAYGANVDDQGDFRPGMKAAGEHGAVAPLLEAGLGKDEIRRLARGLGLPNWDKPARACLSSRIPHGVPVTPERLSAIELAEEALYAHGFRQVRVRLHGEIARIELAEEEMARLIEPDLRTRVTEAVRKAGFRFVALDLEGYRQGSLNPRPGVRIDPGTGAEPPVPAQRSEPAEDGGQ